MKTCIARISLLVCLLPLPLAHAYAQPPSQQSYTCDDNLDDPARGRAVEASLMAKTKGMASRPSAHVLVVRVAGKTLTFRDVPGEPLSNIAYRFCTSHDGYTLIRWENGDVFTGELVDESTGKILPGGQSVLFSPDRRAYFADRQEDGMDGQVWTVYSADGRRAWEGASFFPAGPQVDPKSVHSLSSPGWSTTGELVAQAECLNGSPAPAKLIKVNGIWSWHVPTRCKPGA